MVRKLDIPVNMPFPMSQPANEISDFGGSFVNGTVSTSGTASGLSQSYMYFIPTAYPDPNYQIQIFREAKIKSEAQEIRNK